LLAVLALFLSAEEETRNSLGALTSESGVVHREAFENGARLFFETPAAAAQAALRITAEVSGSIGLHAGPVHFAVHSLTGNRVARGEHAAKADDLAACQPAGLIYTSQAFAALLGLEPMPGVRCEFLGYRALRPQDAREPIFQLRSINALAALPVAPS